MKCDRCKREVDRVYRGIPKSLCPECYGAEMAEQEVEEAKIEMAKADTEAQLWAEEEEQ